MSARPMINVYEPDADGVEVLVYREMNDGEYADWSAEQANTATQTLEQARTVKAASIRAELAASDVWSARHIEDGKSLTPERISYRQTLRGLLDSVATSTDPDSITIPDAPPLPKS